MNITTFNREFSELDFLPGPSHPDLPPSTPTFMPRKVLDAPIFVWKDFEDEKLVSLPDYGDVISYIQSEENSLPFRTMRLYIEANDVDRKNGVPGYKFWLHQEAGELHIRFAPQPNNSSYPFMVGFRVPRSGDQTATWFRKGDRHLNLDDLAHTTDIEGLRSYVAAIFTSLAWFIRESREPSLFVAKVEPVKKGKSAAWTAARSHYVLVQRDHPANVKGRSSTDRVTDQDIKRMAHTRRAHTRILRSDRWGKNKGKMIRVKSCWVGPKEWEQAGSIYRIVD